jgi:hypothetical protein
MEFMPHAASTCLQHRTGQNPLESADARLIAPIGSPYMTRTLQEYEWVAAK